MSNRPLCRRTGYLYPCFEEKEAMKTPICVCLSGKNSVSRTLGAFKATGLVLLAVGASFISGCSSGSSSLTPQVGNITFTDTNGTPQKTQPTSLTVGQGTYVDVTLTNDSQLLGADWSVSCGSAPAPGTPLPPGQVQDQSCGTFTPAHTISGPIPTYVTNGAGYVALYTAPSVPPKQGVVTLYASATSDHSRFTTVTLTIGGQPISVGFAPGPPSTLGAGASQEFRAALNNDATNAGVKWSVICGSSDCGSFNPTTTTSGVSTIYTAPAAIPTGGAVQISATSIADPTKAAAATIQIVPISVSVTPVTLSVPTAGTGSLTATVVNDGIGKGVDWSVSCANTMSPQNCGSVTAHTASGVPAIYTAPSSADIAVGSTVTVTAKSTSDPTKRASAIITMIEGGLVNGTAQAAQQPLRDAQVTLYVAVTSQTALNDAAGAHNASAIITTWTDEDGNFSIPYGYECPAPNAQMYLVSTGGNAGGGTNPDLTLMATLGPCSRLDASHFVINEATTTAAVYALSGFMVDAQHIGSNSVAPVGMADAFATANDLVDVTTGVTRARTVSGSGVVPRATINTVANLLSACAKTAGSVQGDSSACDLLFRATNPGNTPTAQTKSTIQALLYLARNATGYRDHPTSFSTLYQLAETNAAFEPMLSVQPSVWTLSIEFPNGRDGTGTAADELSSSNGSLVKGPTPSVDAAGNIWFRSSDNGETEFVGAASCAGAPEALAPITVNAGSTP